MSDSPEDSTSYRHSNPSDVLRPYSTSDANHHHHHHHHSPSSRPADTRYSSASLSNPQLPFYALPRVSSNVAFSGPALSQSDFDTNTNTNTKIPSSFDTSFSSIDSPPSPSSSRNTDRSITRCFPEPPTSSMSDSSSDSSSSSSSTSASSYTSDPTSQSSGSDQPDRHSSTTSHQSSSDNSQPHIIESPRPVSPFRAPQPPQPQPSRTPLFQPTAMRRYMMPSLDTTSYPSPDPPVILPTDNTTIMNQSSFQSQAPYFPFLSHAPPPENSWIEVETLQNEYRLHVHLPGFTREGITLATKRRRILHVVADKWENGGGHFERRISFGYDADLVQVRADFDGLMLRIMIPRRISPITLHTTARSTPPAAVGRT